MSTEDRPEPHRTRNRMARNPTPESRHAMRESIVPRSLKSEAHRVIQEYMPTYEVDIIRTLRRFVSNPRRTVTEVEHLIANLKRRHKP